MESVHSPLEPTRLPRCIIIGLNQHREETKMKEMFDFFHTARSSKFRERAAWISNTESCR